MESIDSSKCVRDTLGHIGWFPNLFSNMEIPNTKYRLLSKRAKSHRQLLAPGQELMHHRQGFHLVLSNRCVCHVSYLARSLAGAQVKYLLRSVCRTVVLHPRRDREEAHEVDPSPTLPYGRVSEILA